MTLSQKYLKRIRGTKKRLYGFAYYGYLLGKRSLPRYKDYGVGTMAAQAVEMELRKLASN